MPTTQQQQLLLQQHPPPPPLPRHYKQQPSQFPSQRPNQDVPLGVGAHHRMHHHRPPPLPRSNNHHRGRLFSLCLRLTLAAACLMLAWQALASAMWVSTRVTLARDYLSDVRDITDLAERPGVRDVISSLVRSGALARVPRDVLGRIHLTSLSGGGGGDAGGGVAAAWEPEPGVVSALSVDVSHSGVGGTTDHTLTFTRPTRLRATLPSSPSRRRTSRATVCFNLTIPLERFHTTDASEPRVHRACTWYSMNKQSHHYCLKPYTPRVYLR